MVTDCSRAPEAQQQPHLSVGPVRVPLWKYVGRLSPNSKVALYASPAPAALLWSQCVTRQGAPKCSSQAFWKRACRAACTTRSGTYPAEAEDIGYSELARSSAKDHMVLGCMKVAGAFFKRSETASSLGPLKSLPRFEQYRMPWQLNVVSTPDCLTQISGNG